MGTQVIVVPSCFISTRRFFDKVTKTSERIDIEKLKAREQIMFFDDVLLFEDELHDHGVSMISVKIVSSVHFFFLIIHPFSTLADTLFAATQSETFDFIFCWRCREWCQPVSSCCCVSSYEWTACWFELMTRVCIMRQVAFPSSQFTGPFEHCCVWVHKSFFITFMLLFFSLFRQEIIICYENSVQEKAK